jgi:DNA-directed RNA polymerase subunit delta
LSSQEDTGLKTLRERISFLQGVASAAGLKDKGAEGQVIAGLLDAVEELARAVEQIRSSQEEVEDYLDSIDEDLADLEEDFYGEALDEDEDDESAEEGDGGCSLDVECPGCGQSVHLSFDGEEIESLELTCPNCGELVCVQEEDDEGEG